jgi:hypothetical protein
MKKVSLNLSERYTALPILQDFKGKLSDLALILEDIKQFPITNEEWKQAERVISMKAKVKESGLVGMVNVEDFKVETMEKVDDLLQWNWNDEKGGEKAMELNDVTVSFIKNFINEKSEKGEIELADKVFITLLAKLS